MVQGSSGAQQAHVGTGTGATGTFNSTQNAPITNAEVDQIVNESRRAGTATPPVPPQQQSFQQGQQPYQARVKGQGQR